MGGGYRMRSERGQGVEKGGRPALARKTLHGIVHRKSERLRRVPGLLGGGGEVHAGHGPAQRAIVRPSGQIEIFHDQEGSPATERVVAVVVHFRDAEGVPAPARRARAHGLEAQRFPAEHLLVRPGRGALHEEGCMPPPLRAVVVVAMIGGGRGVGHRDLPEGSPVGRSGGDGLDD